MLVELSLKEKLVLYNLIMSTLFFLHRVMVRTRHAPALAPSKLRKTDIESEKCNKDE